MADTITLDDPAPSGGSTLPEAAVEHVTPRAPLLNPDAAGTIRVQVPVTFGPSGTYADASQARSNVAYDVVSLVRALRTAAGLAVEQDAGADGKVPYIGSQTRFTKGEQDGTGTVEVIVQWKRRRPK